MERKKRIDFGNGPTDVTEVGYRASGEHWNEYLLDDKTVLRVKTVVTEVVRVDGMYDEGGDPAYLIKSQNVISVSAPEELRRNP